MWQKVLARLLVLQEVTPKMKKTKLQLIKQTIRCLQDSELAQAYGGVVPKPDGPTLGSSVCRVED
jgi:hypothetical protein